MFCLSLAIGATLLVAPRTVNAAYFVSLDTGEGAEGESKSADEKAEGGSDTQNVEDLQKNSDMQNVKILQENIEKLKENMETLEKQNNENNFLVYSAIALSIISLLLSLISTGLHFIKSGQFKKIDNSRRKNIQELAKRISVLENKAEELENTLQELEETKKILGQDKNELALTSKEDSYPLTEEDVNNNKRVVDVFPTISPTPKREAESVFQDSAELAVNTNQVSTRHEAPTILPKSRYLDLQQRDVLAAFQNMTQQIAKVSAYEGKIIRANFAKEYLVHAFKCVNAEQRVNNRELSPVFTETTLTEGTLWGIPLQDGTLAVFPNLREYESSIHYQGGMKELFDSNYSNGVYRQIKVKTPALIAFDHQGKDFDSNAIKQIGELRLN